MSIVKTIVFLLISSLFYGCGTGAPEGSNLIPKQPDVVIDDKKPKDKLPSVDAGKDTKIRVGRTDLISAIVNKGNITNYKWTEHSKVLSTKQSFKYTPESMGTHKLKITVTDDKNKTASDIITVDVTNKLPLVVIRVEFDDFPFHSDASTWSEKIFGTNEGQLNHYYNEISYGKLQFEKVQESDGASDGVITIHLNEDHPGNGVDFQTYLPKIIKKTDSFIDYSKYDVNNDTNISSQELQVMFIFSGGENATSNYPGIWAHASCISDAPTLDGKKIMNCGCGTYSIFGERHKMNGTQYDATIGIIAHELGHAALDLVDLYDTDDSSQGIGNFGLMGSGNWGQKTFDEKAGTTPIHMLAWNKIQSKFIKPITVENDTSLEFIESSNQDFKAYKIPTKNSNEYFLVENRENSGYDKGLFILDDGTKFEGGLLISHIDESIDKYNSPNNNEAHKMVDIEEANNPVLDTNGSSRGHINNLYFSSNSNSFTPQTTPNSNLYDGLTSGISITNISDSGASMSANIELQ